MLITNLTCASLKSYLSQRLYILIDEDMDGETIESLAQSGTIEQFKSCGFTKVGDQLKLRKLLIGDSKQSSSSKLVGNNVTIQVSSNGKLTLAEMKKLTPEERRVYLMKYVYVHNLFYLCYINLYKLYLAIMFSNIMCIILFQKK